MRRVLLLCIKVAVVVAVAVWLANRPGAVTIDWLGVRIETTIGILILAAVALAVAVALLYRFWLFLYGSPRSLRRVLDNNRRRGAYKALSHGMLAVAAGDSAEAGRWARKAENLLQDPPLTQLLSAQAAQLVGDEKAAKRYFTAMLDDEETRFLGLRGLLVQALRDGDDAAALDYVRRAHAMRPDTPWVLTSLFELSERTGDLETAEKALKSAAKAKALPATDVDGKRATLYLEQALAAERVNKRELAYKFARKAHKQKPEMLAASLNHARLAMLTGRPREAQKVLESAWAERPQCELAAAYLAIRPDATPIDRVKRLKKLIAAKPNDPESHLVLAEASLEAGLWGEVRRHVDAALGDAVPSARVCRLMARLEEAENGDSAAARRWLERAGSAPPDPAWVCTNCGAVAADWSVHCGACNAFDTLAWGLPPGSAVAVAEPGPAGVAEAEAEDAELVEDAEALPPAGGARQPAATAG